MSRHVRDYRKETKEAEKQVQRHWPWPYPAGRIDPHTGSHDWQPWLSPPPEDQHRLKRYLNEPLKVNICADDNAAKKRAARHILHAGFRPFEDCRLPQPSDQFNEPPIFWMPGQPEGEKPSRPPDKCDLAPPPPTNPSRQKAIQCCSGPWHRASVVPILHRGNHDIVFLHPTQQGVDLLNNTPSYKVFDMRTGAAETIDNFRALNMVTQQGEIIAELATSDIITCYNDPQLCMFMTPLLRAAARRRGRGMVPMLILSYDDWGGRYPYFSFPQPVRHNAGIDKPLFMEDRLDSNSLLVSPRNANVLELASRVDCTMVNHAEGYLNVQVERKAVWSVNGFIARLRSLSLPGISHRIERDGQRIETCSKLVRDFAFMATAYYGFNRNTYYIQDAIRLPEVRDNVVNLVTALTWRAWDGREMDSILEALRCNRNYACSEWAAFPRTNLRTIWWPVFINYTGWPDNTTAFMRVLRELLQYQNVGDDIESQELGRRMRTLSGPEAFYSLIGPEPWYYRNGLLRRTAKRTDDVDYDQIHRTFHDVQELTRQGKLGSGPKRPEASVLREKESQATTIKLLTASRAHQDAWSAECGSTEERKARITQERQKREAVEAAAAARKQNFPALTTPAPPSSSSRRPAAGAAASTAAMAGAGLKSPSPPRAISPSRTARRSRTASPSATREAKAAPSGPRAATGAADPSTPTPSPQQPHPRNPNRLARSDAAQKRSREKSPSSPGTTSKEHQTK